MYKPMTKPVPKASDKGIFFCGSLTSPAVKVMLFQASDEKSEPTCATQKAIKSPYKPFAAETPGATSATFVGVQALAKFAEKIPACPPMKSPKRIKAASARVFVTVKVF